MKERNVRMKLQPAVKKETAHIALGVAVGVAVMPVSYTHLRAHET